MSGFGSRLTAAVASRGPLCPGIDPHPELLAAWGLTADPDGLAAFCDVCVAAFAGFAIVKPQVAFFEAYGAAGFAVLRVPHEGMIHGANGMTDYTANTVAVRENMDPAAQVKTLAHELGHVLLHGPDQEEARQHRGIGEVEAALSLGFGGRDARMMVISASAPDALLPNVDQARTAGLVTLPGAFVGVLLATGSAAQAGAVQVLVLVGLLLSQTCAVALTIELIARGRISRTAHVPVP